MKKITAMALLLSMVLSLSACGDTGSDSSSEGTEKTTTAAAVADESKSAETEKPAESEAEPETTTEAVVTEPLNTNVVHAEFANNVLNMSASFDVANIDGFETQEGTQDPDQFIAKGGYGYPDPEWYSSAISIEYRLRPISAYHVEALENKGESYEAYDKVDIGSAYDTYLRKNDGSYGASYDLLFVGGDYLDGAFVMEFTVMPQLDSAKADDVDLIVDTIARSIRLEADDQMLKTADGFSIAQNGITCKNKATVAGEEVEMKQSVYTNDNYISAQTSFIADGIGYDFRSLNVDGMDRFGIMGGGEYADCTLAGKPGKIKLSVGVGTIEVSADVQIDDEKILHMGISSDSTLTQGELSDAAKLADAIADMMSDENKEATQEKFVGYINDILAAFSLS